MKLQSARTGKCYEVGTIIRQKGKFSAVYSSIDLSNNLPVVIKQLSEKLLHPPADFVIHSNNIHLIKANDCFEYNDITYIVVPYIAGVDARSYFSKNKKEQATIIAVFYQLMECLKSLHVDGWLHLDIKSDNILIANSNGTITPYLIDFGMAKQTNDIHNRMPFSIAYAAPERILQMNSFVGLHSDIYSLCMCAYEWFTGHIPHEHQNPEFMMQLRITQPLERNKRIPDTFFSILKLLTTPPAIKRPVGMYTAAELNAVMLENISMRTECINKMSGLSKLKY
jgi:serine/threonine protein kinase